MNDKDSLYSKILNEVVNTHKENIQIKTNKDTDFYLKALEKASYEAEILTHKIKENINNLNNND